MFETRNIYYQNFNFNYKTYRDLIISPLIVTTTTTFFVYLLHLMTNNYSQLHQKFLILKFCHKY